MADIEEEVIDGEEPTDSEADGYAPEGYDAREHSTPDDDDDPYDADPDPFDFEEERELE